MEFMKRGRLTIALPQDLIFSGLFIAWAIFPSERLSKNAVIRSQWQFFDCPLFDTFLLVFGELRVCILIADVRPFSLHKDAHSEVHNEHYSS